MKFKNTIDLDYWVNKEPEITEMILHLYHTHTEIVKEKLAHLTLLNKKGDIKKHLKPNQDVTVDGDRVNSVYDTQTFNDILYYSTDQHYTSLTYNCDEYYIGKYGNCISYENYVDNYDIDYTINEDCMEVIIHDGSYSLLTISYAHSMVRITRYLDDTQHSLIGPAMVEKDANGKVHYAYYVHGKSLHKWIKDKGWTLPLNDKQLYEMQLKYGA